MDREYIENEVFNNKLDNSRLITEHDTITKDVIDLLKNAKTSVRGKAFAQPTAESYQVYLQCSKCGEVFNARWSKTRILEYCTKSYREYTKRYRDKLCMCKKCLNDEKEREEVELQKSHLEFKMEKLQQTHDYIEKYLNPENSFLPNTKPNERKNAIMANSWIDDDSVADAVKQMNYYDFLKTPYWDGIRKYKLYKANYKCSLCGNKDNLNVHHRSYDRHGYEHLYKVANEDLIVLCKECHSKFHDKLEESEE